MVGGRVKAITGGERGVKVSQRDFYLLPGVQSSAERFEEGAIRSVAAFRERRTVPRFAGVGHV